MLPRLSHLSQTISHSLWNNNPLLSELQHTHKSMSRYSDKSNQAVPDFLFLQQNHKFPGNNAYCSVLP